MILKLLKFWLTRCGKEWFALGEGAWPRPHYRNGRRVYWLNPWRPYDSYGWFTATELFLWGLNRGPIPNGCKHVSRNTPAGPVDVREARDVAHGLWLWIDPKSLEGLERVAEPRPGYPVVYITATCHALVFALDGRCMAMVLKNAKAPDKLLHALDWVGVAAWQFP